MQTMKVEYINPFVTGAFTVLSMMLGEAPEKGSLNVLPKSFTSQQVNVVLGVTGEVQGMLLIGMSLVTADKIASMMIGQPVKTFDELASSAIAELGNMIGGNGLLQLSETGLHCDLTPPTVIRGTNVEISTLALPAIVVPLKMSLGEISLTVGLRSPTPR